MNILVIGGDSRMKFTAAELGASLYPTADGEFDIVVLPMPLTRDGENIVSQNVLTFDLICDYAADNAVVFAGGSCERLSEICTTYGFRLVNYAEYEPLALRNAALTAEAAVCLLSQSTERALLNSRILITGYGRIASLLAARLAVFGAEVNISARRAEQRVQAELDGFSAYPISLLPEIAGEFDYIVNTVPAPIFPDCFGEMREGTVFLELATLPNNPPDNSGIKYIHGGGLPGKHFPETAGKFIAGAITEIYRAEMCAQ